MNDNLETTLATELIHEIKAQSKRWFIAFIIMIIVEAFTITGFLWYISLPVEEETVQVENDGGNTNYIGRNLNGVINNGENNGQ